MSRRLPVTLRVATGVLLLVGWFFAALALLKGSEPAAPKPIVRTVTVSASCPALLHHDQQLQRDLQVMSHGFVLARQDWQRGFRYVMPRFAAVPRTPPTCGETR